MRQVHDNARISTMKTALDTDLNPTVPASLLPADLLRIIAEKDRVIAEHKALLEEREVRLKEHKALLEEREARLKEREALLAEQQKLLRLLEEQLRLARLRKFGSSSEKQPFQGELFDEAELEVSLEEVEQELAEAEVAAGAEPKKPRKRRKADVAIGKIRKLYAIEKRIRDLDPEEKTRQRQQQAQPVLDDLKAWLEKNVTRVPRNSLTYQAMQYTLNQWELLIGYLEDGRLHISNALAEQASLRSRERFWDIRSPKSTRSSTTHWCPGRPGHPAFRHNIASSLRLHTGLPYDWTPRSDAPLGSPLAPSARRVSRVASRLPGTTRLRFALHGGQRMPSGPSRWDARTGSLPTPRGVPRPAPPSTA